MPTANTLFSITCVFYIANNRDICLAMKRIQIFHKVLYRTATNIGYLTVLYQRFYLILESERDVVGKFKVKVSKVLVKFCHVLSFCHSKTSHMFSKNPPNHQKYQIDNLCENINMDVSSIKIAVIIE